MKPRKQLLTTFSVLLIAALLVACVSPAVVPMATTAQPTTTPIPPTPVPATAEPTPVAAAPELSPPQGGLRPDAPEFAKHGPFWVGYKSLVIDEGGDRPLEAGLWYPALNPKGAEEEITYPIKLKVPLDPIDAPVVAYGHALQDAEVDPSAGPYPLVIFSHGFGSNAVWYNTLLEHYASHGFIVLAPEHIEQFDPEYSDIWKASIDRPLDIKRTLDYAEQITAPGGDMAERIDMQHVAVAGHSYGGYAALAMAGAQYDLAAFNARCAKLASDDPHTFLCAPLVPKEADMAARAGLDPLPEGLWPSLGDPRVTAIIPMAGDSYLFDKAGLAKITIPMMAIGGTADTGTPYEWGSKPSYVNASSAKKALVTLEGAEHTITTSCKNMPWLGETPFGPWICFDPVWDKDRGLDLIHHFSTAFLLDTLKGDAAAAAALAPENVTFPGIKYETTGYGAAPKAKLDDATVTKIEAQVAKTMTDNKIPGYALGIVKDGRIVYTQSFGVERVGGDKPVTPHTVFGTGSVGKTATATAIMQLVAEGKIDLDAPVTDYLPYFKLADARYKDITVRHLITHRSGLPEIQDWLPLPVEYDDGALERYVRSLDKVRLLFAPDKGGFSYSSMGFTVLADIEAKVSGQTFEAYLQEHIVDPLGMSDTMLIVPEADQEHVASPHVRNDSAEVAVTDEFPYRRQYAATGPLYSSITDMTRYAAAHLNRGEFEGTRILPATTYDAMWEPISDHHISLGPVMTPLFDKFGMSWEIGEIDGHRIVQHFGYDVGYCAVLLLAPDDNVALVMSSNYFDEAEFNVSAWETAVKVMQMILTEGQ